VHEHQWRLLWLLVEGHGPYLANDLTLLHFML
jgi:hypothetical protein